MCESHSPLKIILSGFHCITIDLIVSMYSNPLKAHVLVIWNSWANDWKFTDEVLQLIQI